MLLVTPQSALLALFVSLDAGMIVALLLASGSSSYFEHSAVVVQGLPVICTYMCIADTEMGAAR